MWPFSKSIEDVLYKTKDVRILGVKFTIKRIDPTAYLDGSKVMLQTFDTYKIEKTPEAANKNIEKVKEHYRDVFMASVISPVLTRKPGEPGIPVDHLFTEWELANELYTNIIEHTYGKKKA